MEMAVKDYKDGLLKLDGAAKKYGIPRSTVHTRLHTEI